MEISLNGTAFKYTNFVFGFQERYFKLKSGVIYYYLSKETEKEGCRKFRVLSNFRLELDDDPFRFDIVFPDERWSLRFCNREELVLWRDALQAFSKYPLEVVEELRLMSTTSSNSTQSSFFAVECDVQEQLPSGTSILDPNALYKLREEMPEQLSSVIKVLDCCLRSDELNPSIKSSSDLETAIEKCHQLTNNLEQAKSVLKTISSKMKQPASLKDLNGPMLATNTNKRSVVSDEEDVDDLWEDAVDNDNQNGHSNQQDNKLQNGGVSKSGVLQPIVNAINRLETESSQPDNSSPTSSRAESSQKALLFDEIRRISGEQLRHALAGVEDGQWELFVRDGEMKMYKMEQEVLGPDGKKVVIDPLKAKSQIGGVSAREYIDLFFDPDLKSEWDDTLVKIKTIERLSEDTVILHQLHRRVWPSAQRESLFWSQKRDVSGQKDDGAIDAFMVCSHDLDREDVPLTKPSCVRVKLSIAMVCQTVVESHAKHLTLDKLKRQDVRCKITYVAQVHPGGWVPSFGLRQIYKVEYPKFLKSFTEYVVKKVKDKPLHL